jgi:hypothetical protein
MSRVSIDKEKEIEQEVNNAMKTYYKLKSEYEDKRYANKLQIINNKALSWKEKRHAFQKLAPKCINCNRPVGTIFSNKVIDLEHHLMAVCGDKKEPCQLNIDINKGIIMDNYTFAMDDKKLIDDIKTQVIINKNDLLFGYITSENAVSKFDAIKEQLKDLTQSYEYSIQQYYNIVDNSEKQDGLLKIQSELNANISALKHLMQDYDKTQNVSMANDAVELYVNEIMPKLEKIMSDKYSYCEVETESIGNNEVNFILVQKTHTVEELEWNLGKPGVISMKMGNSDNMLKKKKTANEVAAPVPTTGLIPDITDGPLKIQLKPEKLKPSEKISKKLVIIDKKSSDEQVEPLEIKGEDEDDKETDEDEENMWDRSRL